MPELELLYEATGLLYEHTEKLYEEVSRLNLLFHLLSTIWPEDHTLLRQLLLPEDSLYPILAATCHSQIIEPVSIFPAGRK